MKLSVGIGAIVVAVFCILYAFLVVQRQPVITDTRSTRYAQKIEPLPRNVVLLKTINLPYLRENGEPVVIEDKEQIARIMRPLYGKEKRIDERMRMGNYYMRAPTVELQIVPSKESGEQATIIYLYDDTWEQDFGLDFAQAMQSLPRLHFTTVKKSGKRLFEVNGVNNR